MNDIDMSDWGLPARTKHPYDAPSAIELIQAVEDCITDEIMPALNGANKWKLRIAANALKIAMREIQEGNSRKDDLQTIFSDLDAVDATDLSKKIQSGGYDDKFEILHEKLLAIVTMKLDVANPDYFIEKQNPLR